MRALVLVGHGRYSDPWHPLPETGRRLATIAEQAGFVVELDDDVDRSLARLDGIDLLVVDATDPWRNGETGSGAPPGSVLGLSTAIRRGIGILAVHNAIASLRDYPDWRPAVGGDWTPGVSMHPPLELVQVQVGPSDHVIVDDLPGLDDDGGFRVLDERYTLLDVDDDVVPLAAHRYEGRRHPLLWAREIGRSRLVYDALGHDGRSYDSVTHREIVRRAMVWAADRPSWAVSP